MERKKKERKVWDDILAFLGSRGCSHGLLEQVLPSFFSPLLSHLKTYAFTVKTKESGVVLAGLDTASVVLWTLSIPSLIMFTFTFSLEKN